MRKSPLFRLMSLFVIAAFLVAPVWTCSRPTPAKAQTSTTGEWVVKELGLTGHAVTFPDGEWVVSNHGQLVTIFNELNQSDMTPLQLMRVTTAPGLSGPFWTRIETGAGAAIPWTDLARGISASGSSREDLVMATYELFRITGLNTQSDRDAAKQAKAEMLVVRGDEFSQEFSPDGPTSSVYDVKVVSLNVLTGEKIGTGEKTLASFAWPVTGRISMNYAGQWAVVFVPPSDPANPTPGEVWASLGTSAGVLQVTPVRIWEGDPQISEGAVALDVVSDQVALVAADAGGSKLGFCAIHREGSPWLECGGRLLRIQDLGLNEAWSFTSVTAFENPTLGLNAVVTAKSGNTCLAYLVTDNVTDEPIGLGGVDCDQSHTHISATAFPGGNTLVVFEAVGGVWSTEIAANGVVIESNFITGSGEYPIARTLNGQFCVTYVQTPVGSTESKWLMACKDPAIEQPTPTPSPTTAPTMTATATTTTAPVLTSTKTATPMKTLTPTKTQKPPTATRTPSPTKTSKPVTPTKTPTPTLTPVGFTPSPTPTPAARTFLPLLLQLGQ